MPTSRRAETSRTSADVLRPVTYSLSVWEGEDALQRFLRAATGEAAS